MMYAYLFHIVFVTQVNHKYIDFLELCSIHITFVNTIPLRFYSSTCRIIFVWRELEF